MQTVLWRDREFPVPPIDLSDPEMLHRHEFFVRASQYLSFNEIRGDYAEFGCASARTFRLAYDALRVTQQLDCMLWAFDSFEGLPQPADLRDEHPKWTAGNFPTPLDLFDKILESHGIPRGGYRTVPGIYAKTIGANSHGSDALAPKIALAYVDCDMHSSSADVLHFLFKRLRHGMIVAFDDYFCYSETAIAGERLALQEFLVAQPRWEFVPYGQIGWHGQAFVVEDTALRNSSRLGRQSRH